MSLTFARIAITVFEIMHNIYLEDTYIELFKALFGLPNYENLLVWNTYNILQDMTPYSGHRVHKFLPFWAEICIFIFLPILNI